MGVLGLAGKGYVPYGLLSLTMLWSGSEPMMNVLVRPNLTKEKDYGNAEGLV